MMEELNRRTVPTVRGAPDAVDLAGAYYLLNKRNRNGNLIIDDIQNYINEFYKDNYNKQHAKKLRKDLLNSVKQGSELEKMIKKSLEDFERRFFDENGNPIPVKKEEPPKESPFNEF